MNDFSYLMTGPPRKGPDRRQLAEEAKNFNHDINSARVAIENISQHLETYTILVGVYKWTGDHFYEIVNIV